jgi:hypothetical protein
MCCHFLRNSSLILTLTLISVHSPVWSSIHGTRQYGRPKSKWVDGVIVNVDTFFIDLNFQNIIWLMVKKCDFMWRTSRIFAHFSIYRAPNMHYANTYNEVDEKPSEKRCREIMIFHSQIDLLSVLHIHVQCCTLYLPSSRMMAKFYWDDAFNCREKAKVWEFLEKPQKKESVKKFHIDGRGHPTKCEEWSALQVYNKKKYENFSRKINGFSEQYLTTFFGLCILLQCWIYCLCIGCIGKEKLCTNGFVRWIGI